MNSELQPRHRREITINSDWTMLVSAGILLIVVSAFLIIEARNFVLGHVSKTVSFTTLICVPFGFLVAFSLGPKLKLMKVAILMVGTAIASRFTLHYLHTSVSVQHFAAVGGSIVNQIALTIILIAEVQWLRSVIRWVPTSNSGDVDS